MSSSYEQVREVADDYAAIKYCEIIARLESSMSPARRHAARTRLAAQIKAESGDDGGGDKPAPQPWGPPLLEHKEMSSSFAACAADAIARAKAAAGLGEDNAALPVGERVLERLAELETRIAERHSALEACVLKLAFGSLPPHPNHTNTKAEG